MSRSDAKDFALRWQAFLIDGLPDWLPLATIASAQYPKSTPRQILRSMISDFYFPEGVQQSDENIRGWVEGFAIKHNLKQRDPKTGEIIGNARDIAIKEGRIKAPPEKPNKSRLSKLRKTNAAKADKVK